MRPHPRSVVVPALAVLALVLRGCSADGTNTGNADCAVRQVPPDELPGRAKGSGCTWGVGLGLVESGEPDVSGVVRVDSTGTIEPTDECVAAILDSRIPGGFTIDLAWGVAEDFVDELGALRAHWEHVLGDHLIAVRPQVRVHGERYAFIRAMELTITPAAELTATLQIAHQREDGGVEESELRISGPVFLDCPHGAKEAMFVTGTGATVSIACGRGEVGSLELPCDDTPSGWGAGCSVAPLAPRPRLGF